MQLQKLVEMGGAPDNLKTISNNYPDAIVQVRADNYLTITVGDKILSQENAMHMLLQADWRYIRDTANKFAALQNG